MTKSAYHRVEEILYDLRQCILELPPRGSNEEEACNKEIKKLHDELDEICSRAHVYDLPPVIVPLFKLVF